MFGCEPMVSRMESSCRHVVYALQAARMGFRIHSLAISRCKENLWRSKSFENECLPVRVSSRFPRPCSRWRMDRLGCWWSKDRSVQKLYRPDRHPTRNDHEDFRGCAMKDFTFDEVAAKTVPKVPWPMNFFRRIVSNGMRKPSEERSEKIFERNKLVLFFRKDSFATTNQIGCNGM